MAFEFIITVLFDQMKWFDTYSLLAYLKLKEDVVQMKYHEFVVYAFILITYEIT